MDVIVDGPLPVRTEGDLTVIPVVEEVLVTAKQLRLVEEVRITRVRSTNVHHQNVTLRAEDIAVERHAPVSSMKAGEERLDDPSLPR
jgi:stress response protein YsnF